jgi:hypothetical protein
MSAVVLGAGPQDTIFGRARETDRRSVNVLFARYAAGRPGCPLRLHDPGKRFLPALVWWIGSTSGRLRDRMQHRVKDAHPAGRGPACMAEPQLHRSRHEGQPAGHRQHRALLVGGAARRGAAVHTPVCEAVGRTG